MSLNKEISPLKRMELMKKNQLTVEDSRILEQTAELKPIGLWGFIKSFRDSEQARITKKLTLK